MGEGIKMVAMFLFVFFLDQSNLAGNSQLTYSKMLAYHLQSSTTTSAAQEQVLYFNLPYG